MCLLPAPRRLPGDPCSHSDCRRTRPPRLAPPDTLRALDDIGMEKRQKASGCETRVRSWNDLPAAFSPNTGLFPGLAPQKTTAFTAPAALEFAAMRLSSIPGLLPPYGILSRTNIITRVTFEPCAVVKNAHGSKVTRINFRKEGEGLGSRLCAPVKKLLDSLSPVYFIRGTISISLVQSIRDLYPGCG